MSHFVIAGDDNGRDNDNVRMYLAEIANYLKRMGHTADVIGIGPNILQSYGLQKKASGSIGLIFVNGSDLGMYIDFYNGLRPGGYYHFDKMGVLFYSWMKPTNPYITCQGLRTYKLKRAWDDHYSSAEAIKKYEGITAHDFFTEHSDRIFYACTTKSGFEGCKELAEIAASQGYGGSSGSTTVPGQYSNPMLEGEKTFQDIISEICNGIDILFLCKKNGVVVTDFEQIYADAVYLRENAGYKDKDIELWQLEDGSFEMNTDQFGFYTAVAVYYNGGMVYEQYDDLVDIYGIQVKEFNDKGLNKTQARAKAKAYLAALVREFNMGVNASVLETGIDIGDMVMLPNPMAKHKGKDIPEYLFTQGVSIDWDGDIITTDLELKYAPESPERPEIPVTGVGHVNQNGTSTGNVNKNQLLQIGDDLASKYGFSHSSSTYCGLRSVGSGDCFAWSAALWQELRNAGYIARIIQYPTNEASNHRSVQYKNNNGKWVDYPYRQSHIPKAAWATSGSKNGEIVLDENGSGRASNTIC